MPRDWVKMYEEEEKRELEAMEKALARYRASQAGTGTTTTRTESPLGSSEAPQEK